MKKINCAWSISLLLIGICSIIQSMSSLLDIDLPSEMVVLLGVIDLLCLPVLSYTTIKKVQNRHTDGEVK